MGEFQRSRLELTAAHRRKQGGPPQWPALFTNGAWVLG